MSHHHYERRHASIHPPRPVMAGWLITVTCLSAIAVLAVLAILL